jgi:prephenate dehydrogenase
MSTKLSISSIGLVGFGAFGRLVANHLDPFFALVVNDPAMSANDGQLPGRAVAGSAAEICRCDLIILAVPVSELANAIKCLRPHLRPGCTVVDVGSVKVKPARVMLEELPPFVDIVGTHPLFGPQSGGNGIKGRKIAVCPVRGSAVAQRIAAFLRRALGLKVFVTSPEEHDWEAAVVQGVTHLIAKVLVRMEPLPTLLTTASFDHLMQATEMVRYDAPSVYMASVYMAIERDNPFASAVRERFFALAAEARADLEQHE